MTVSIVHVSDLHLRNGWHEEQGVVLREFFEDLEKQISSLNECFFVFTGDILQSGDSSDDYRYFSQTFGAQLEAYGIGRDRLIIVPGNHDVDRSYTKSKLIQLKALQERPTSETVFNGAVYDELADLLSPKFAPFMSWQKTISDFSLSEDRFCGQGYSISEDIGVYCLNTAIFSFGGLHDERGSAIDDRGQLAIETRSLWNWVINSKHSFKILAMHHPEDWLVDWARREIDRICLKGFDLVLTGHEHKQDVFQVSRGSNKHIRCFAPALFSGKEDTLGYAIIHIDQTIDQTEVQYRQWATDRFVTGSMLSQTDDGVVCLGERQLAGQQPAIRADDVVDTIESVLRNSFSDSLNCYNSVPSLWTTPNIADKPETGSDSKETIVFSADTLVSNPRDCILSAPSQFGMSSLGRYVALESWISRPGEFILVIDSSDIQNHESAIRKYIEDRLNELGLKKDSLASIILDEPGSINDRKVKNIKKEFPDIPLMIFHTLNNDIAIKSEESVELGFDFEALYLWSLDRSQIRDLTVQFTEAGYQLDENAAVQRLIDDLATLNIHRTPLNCLTLLIVYAREIDFSPTNRTDMFERFLFFIFFSYKKNPDYSTFPDMKDALAVLGAFCEKIIRSKENQFSKSEFIKYSNDFCENYSITVDCYLLFDLMRQENIIVGARDNFWFRYVHWVYFFGAHRMHHEKAFCDFVLTESRYMNYPEIIEFYSGVDRRRGELLEILTSDLQTANRAFEARTKILANFDPYENAEWSMSEDRAEKLRQNLEEESKQTSLPVSIKDQIADRNFDRTAPYKQEMKTFANDSSLLECMQILTASARALRNSDYVDSAIKHRLMDEILRAWVKEIQILFLLSPILARERSTVFDNIHFYITESLLHDTDMETWEHLAYVIPTTVFALHEKDIASPRMLPMFREILAHGDPKPEHFLIAAVLITNRPNGWEAAVKLYIQKLSKNSFYLMKIMNLLEHQYKFGFAAQQDKSALFELMAVVIAKHSTGSKMPNKKMVKKAKEQLETKEKSKN